MKTNNKKHHLWGPLALALVLTQCGDKKETGHPGSSEVHPGAGSPVAPAPEVPPTLAPDVESITESQGGRVVLDPGALSDSPSMVDPESFELPEFDRKAAVYQQAMEEAISSGDAAGLVRNFNAAVDLYGDSPSSSTAVLSGLMHHLKEDLDMARKLIDSMDGGFMVASNAFGIAQAIEDEEQRLQWLNSLSNPEVREEVMEMMNPELDP